MTSIVRVNAVFEAASGLPEDRSINVWHFNCDDAVPGGGITDLANVFDMLEDFYLTTPTGGANSTKDWLSKLVAGPFELKAYNLSDPSPRVPIGTRSLSFTTSGTAMPSEVAFKISAKGVIVSGDIPARHKGGVFIGPLNTAGLDTATGRPTAAMILGMRRSLRDLVEASIASINNKWAIYSTADNLAYDVEDGWVDNAFDTQRRRGNAPTARSLWAVGVP